MRKILCLIIIFVLSTDLYSQDDRGYGLKYPTEEHIKSIPFTPQFSLPPKIVLPSLVDLSDRMPPIGNQGYQGSCVAFAVGYASKSYQEMKQFNWHFVDNSNIRNDRICSPSFIFNTIKIMTGNFNCLDGVYFEEAFGILKSMGTSFLSDFPYIEQDCSRQPSSDVVQKSLVNRISSYKRVDSNNLDEVKYNLFVGNPVIIGFTPCDFFQPDGFTAYERGIHFTYFPKGSLNPRKYHAMVCVGYNDDTKSFKLMNSWGDDWGNSGFVDVPYEWFPELVQEAYVLNDALPPGTFVSATKLQDDTIKSFVSPSLYSSWFKEGYYREYNNFRVGLTSLNTKDSSATVIFTDTHKGVEINTVTYKKGVPQTFYYEDKRITFTLVDIGRAGRNFLTKAAYFELTIDNYVDIATQSRIEKINMLQNQREDIQ